MASVQWNFFFKKRKQQNKLIGGNTWITVRAWWRPSVWRRGRGQCWGRRDDGPSGRPGWDHCGPSGVAPQRAVALFAVDATVGLTITVVRVVFVAVGFLGNLGRWNGPTSSVFPEMFLNLLELFGFHLAVLGFGGSSAWARIIGALWKTNKFIVDKFLLSLHNFLNYHVR